ncbi:MAG: hypothetical protein AAF390_00745 [Pseudomonadota bacterium]
MVDVGDERRLARRRNRDVADAAEILREDERQHEPVQGGDAEEDRTRQILRVLLDPGLQGPMCQAVGPEGKRDDDADEGKTG